MYLTRYLNKLEFFLTAHLCIKVTSLVDGLIFLHEKVLKIHSQMYFTFFLLFSYG